VAARKELHPVARPLVFLNINLGIFEAHLLEIGHRRLAVFAPGTPEYRYRFALHIFLLLML
jgi:hypothetical protein